MQLILIVAVCAHVLSAAGWAGFTFAIARAGPDLIGRLIAPQLGAGFTAIVTGVWFWSLTHRSAFGLAEQVLVFGAICALLAVTLQALGALLVVRARPTPPRPAMAAERISAGLVAVTLIAMASARYV